MKLLQKTETNKLIAEFMNLDMYPPHDDYPLLYDCSPIDQDPQWYALEEFQYHTSWNWLMLVVEKIEREYMYAVQPCWEHCIIDTAGENTEDFERIEVDSSDKLSATYGAVVAFITWYNEQQNK